MVSSSSKKISNGGTHKRMTQFHNFPDDLVIVEIMSRVAGSSLTDFFNLKLVSKSLYNLSNDPYVYQNVSLDKIPLTLWYKNPRTSRFLKICRNNGNPEALFRKGIASYFGWKHDTRKGLECLVRAAAKNQREAIYVHGMIMLCGESGTKQKGIDILSSLVKASLSRTMEELEECRDKIGRHIGGRWTDKSLIEWMQRSYKDDGTCKCDDQTKQFLIKNSIWNGYGRDKDHNFPICSNCLWSYEVKLFFRMLRNSAMC